MPAYYDVIAKAVAALDGHTVATRRALYDRARSALIAQLRAIDPPLADKDVERQRLALDDAIEQVEQENVLQQQAVLHRIMTETKLQNAETTDHLLPDQSPSTDVRTSRKKLLSTISNVATTGAGLVVMLALLAIPVLLVLGGVWISEKALDFLVWPVQIAFLLCVLIFLPLSIFRTTRFVSAMGFIISSYVFGASAWFAGLLASYIYFGTFWTVVALFMVAIGVVPLGIVGALFHKDWQAAGLLFGGLVLTFATRAMGAWMGAKIENGKNFDQRLRPAGSVVRALKFCFGFTGRFNRKNFWIGYGIAFVMTMVPILAIETIAPNNSILELVGGLWSILWFVSILAIGTKRLHDVGYSGLLLLAYFALATAAEVMPQTRPFESILAGICVIWLGAAPGEKNPNRFGQWKITHGP